MINDYNIVFITSIVTFQQWPWISYYIISVSVTNTFRPLFVHQGYFPIMGLKLKPTLQHLSCYPVMVHSRFKYAPDWATQWGGSSSHREAPKGSRLREKKVKLYTNEKRKADLFFQNKIFMAQHSFYNKGKDLLVIKQFWFQWKTFFWGLFRTSWSSLILFRTKKNSTG